jgi:hypothetical protein
VQERAAEAHAGLRRPDVEAGAERDLHRAPEMRDGHSALLQLERGEAERPLGEHRRLVIPRRPRLLQRTFGGRPRPARRAHRELDRPLGLGERGGLHRRARIGSGIQVG